MVQNTIKSSPASFLGLVVILVTVYFGWNFYEQDMKKVKQEANQMKKNRLGDEKSPYLLQHKDNPVHWYPWGELAFEAAKRENKPIFLSIGYSTCHWCHVMEEDSFETEVVAQILNKHFISIKVDREERPDVDQIYMDAVVAMTGHGGWPMSVFLTPDLKPFYGGTFFWKDQFIHLLKAVKEKWTDTPTKIKAASANIFQHLQSQELGGPAFDLTDAILKQALTIFLERFDAQYGGFGGAPKFPRSVDLSLLLRLHRRHGNAEALNMVTTTLNGMAKGGMFDHLGGGFARYSTDKEWLTPHFEKMLYDNALLAWTYLEAYQVTDNAMYKAVVQDVLDYILRDMTSTEGGFYSAEDADSEGEEGKFYVWSADELKDLLSEEEYQLFSRIYQVTDEGNFEHQTNILHLGLDTPWDIKGNQALQDISQKLFHIREKRVHPYKDDKVLTAWNGLMIHAMAKAYRVLGDDRYLTAAQNAARFIQTHMFQKGHLLRRYRDGEARFDGYLNDYAYLIFGLLELFEADGDAAWLEWTIQLQKTQDGLFWDDKEGAYFFAGPDSDDLILRQKEMNDGAIPSGNAMALLNLLQLHALSLEKSYYQKSQSLLKALSSYIKRYPPGYAMALVGLDYQLDRSKEIVVLGDTNDKNFQNMKNFLNKSFLPNQVVVYGDGLNDRGLALLKDRTRVDGQTTIYVCENNICQRPTTDIAEAKKMIQAAQPLEQT